METALSWLLFMDESGHDHRTMPYEVRGGIAVHASKLWHFILSVRELEFSLLGAHLHEFGSEIKGSKQLHRYRFEWASKDFDFSDAERHKHALNFLNNGVQGRASRDFEYAAYGQASLKLARGVIRLLERDGAKLFAAIIPRVHKPHGVPADFLRKDQVFLFERYFYFLDEMQETGLLVLDGTEKNDDRRFMRRMEQYFTKTETGRQRTRWIIPSPLFVESDMAYGVQAADLCIYCLNWGYRFGEMTESTRPEIMPFADQLRPLIWHGSVSRADRCFSTHSVCYVPDPYTPR